MICIRLESTYRWSSLCYLFCRDEATHTARYLLRKDNQIGLDVSVSQSLFTLTLTLM